MTDKSLGTFINPFTDFGFKKIFGSEESKPLLISFLNDLLPIKDKIVSLEFKNIEKLGMLEEDRRAIFDIYCRDEKNQEFIVELQRAKQEHFQDRAAYYASFLIQDQAKKGRWDFELTPIYFIDDNTTLSEVPAAAWEYKLGNRSALEWILDQYKEKKPKDATIAEQFNTYHFADYKEQVIDLLMRVCTVSVETLKIIALFPI